MIERIKIGHYRKLKDIELGFSKGVNAISGTNGTCKTSILHLFSNSFQAVTTKADWLTDNSALAIINAINSITNPKIESLTRGDKAYNDPAHGFRGDLFEVEYFKYDKLSFRRHNSTIASRYAVKPKYAKGSNEKLPNCPVIYLGLSRLVPFGEYQDDSTISDVKKKLPAEYQESIGKLYQSFTNYSITYGRQQQMGAIKTRLDFTSDINGIDSNTISAGEDNLSIIMTALVSLQYYFESIDSTREIESVLLIDEIDATLHPSYQIKLLKLFMDFSQKYKIQIVFTTHSITLLEKMFDCKQNVLYLVDNMTNSILMEEADIYKIKMHLQALTEEDIYVDKVIPIFTEDDEARFILKLIFSYFAEHKDAFPSVQRYFHFVHTNIGAENLTGIFSDSKLLRSTMKSICILDGDHSSDLTNCIIALPGKDSPEAFLLKYAKSLYDADDRFWVERVMVDKNYGKRYYIEKIANAVEEFEQKYQELKNNGQRTKGMAREFYKKLFIDNSTFFELLFKHWLNNPGNASEIDVFYNNLRAMFKKVSTYNEINPSSWK